MNKEVSEKKKKYAIIISFLVLMICITGGTYAYFALTASNNSVTGSVGGASLNLSVTKVYPTSEHNNKNMIPQLESTLDEAISLEHKCVDGNGNVICQVYNVIVLNEGSTSVLNGTISFTGIENMPNLKWMRIADSNTLGTYSSSLASTDKALFEENTSFPPASIRNYSFVFWIDETGEVQTDSGTFRANIEFDSSTGGLTSTVRPLLTEYIESLYNDGSSINTVNIAGDTSKPQVHLNDAQGIMLDNNGEYRYYGANPDNYVEYNGELWRIISSSMVYSNEEDTIGNYRVKLVRNESIGNYAWDCSSTGSYSNNWSESTLKTLLNVSYYNSYTGIDYYYDSANETLTSRNYNFKTNGLNSEAKSLIGDSLWYLGGVTGFYDSSVGFYANEHYNFERGNTVKDGNSILWVGKVALIYLSDYLYASDLSLCNEGSLNYSNCVGTNWIVDIGNTQWTLSTRSDSGLDAFYIYSYGGVNALHVYGTAMNDAVHPVVVLKTNVKVTGGDGTSGNPYRLELSE